MVLMAMTLAVRAPLEPTQALKEESGPVQLCEGEGGPKRG